MSDPVIREDYVQRLAAFFKTSADLVKIGLQPGRPEENSEQPLKITLMEEKILEALLRVPEVIPEIKEFFNAELLAGLASRNVIRLLFASYEKHGEFRFAEITKALTAAEKARLNDVFSQKMQVKKDRSEIEKDIVTSIGNFQKKLAAEPEQAIEPGYRRGGKRKKFQESRAVDEAEKRFDQKQRRVFPGGTY